MNKGSKASCSLHSRHEVRQLQGWLRGHSTRKQPLFYFQLKLLWCKMRMPGSIPVPHFNLCDFKLNKFRKGPAPCEYGLAPPWMKAPCFLCWRPPLVWKGLPWPPCPLQVINLSPLFYVLAMLILSQQSPRCKPLVFSSRQFQIPACRTSSLFPLYQAIEASCRGIECGSAQNRD